VGGAKHAKWRGPQDNVAAVPRHKQIGPGLIRVIVICRQLGIPAPENPR
jgi:hypothetical protein